MKKLILLSLAIMMFAGIAMAEPIYTRDPNFNMNSVVFTGSSGGSLSLDSTYIKAGAKVFGFTCTDSAAGTCGMYDSASAAASNNFGEAYVAAGGVETVIFPFPYKIANGFVYGLKASTTVMTVYYE